MKDGQTTKKAQESHSESYFGGDKKSSEKDYGGTSSSGRVTASHYPQEVMTFPPQLWCNAAICFYRRRRQ